MDTERTKELLIDTLRRHLPPLFTRSYVERILGGALKATTLANLDSTGKGPGGVQCGKSVFYERETFIRWFAERPIRDHVPTPRQRGRSKIKPTRGSLTKATRGIQEAAPTRSGGGS